MRTAFRYAVEKYRLKQALLNKIRAQLVKVVSFGNDSGHPQDPGKTVSVFGLMVRY
jgi:hypothetical protein